MHWDLPVCKRCCFCLPLRCGLIVWGYFKLFIASLIMAGIIITWARASELPIADTEPTLKAILVTCVMSILVILDISLTITFMIGCHKKNVKILKTFYFYSQFLLILMTIWSTFELISSVSRAIRNNEDMLVWSFRLMDFGLYVTNIFLQVYILLLVRSEIKKLSNECKFRFVNNSTEPDCTLDIKSVEEGDNNKVVSTK